MTTKAEQWAAHTPCPDCGDDPNDRTLHRTGCPRVGAGPLQFGPPWDPWPDPEELIADDND